MTAAAILPADDKDSLRRWVFAASVVVLLHGAIVSWLMHVRDTSLAGAPPAVIMIELAPLDVAPPTETPPEVTPGPQMRQAEPEEAEPPQTIPVPELPPAPKPNVVLTTPPKPKPKKIVKEVPKPVVKPVREPPAPRTGAPKRSEVARSLTAAAALRQGQAGSAASLASWRARLYAHLLGYKPASAEGAGTVTVSFTLTRGGRLLASGLAGSSGSSALDHKALEMVRRANPYPAAPSEVSGGTFPVTVPIRFR